MEVLRRAANPWGQDVLVGIGWDLVWLAVVASAIFVVGHGLWALTRRAPGRTATTMASGPAGLPDRIPRHSLSARLFHWSMSAAMLVLLVTAFVPVLGLQFDWVPLHWISGLVLVAAVLYHTVHALGWQDWRTMWISGGEVRGGLSELGHAMDPAAEPEPTAGKYAFDHKLYHNVTGLMTIAAIVTGVLMMLRIDTPFWGGNPYVLSDGLWGVTYVVHGLSGVALIGLVTAHIYFAIRPEKRWITWSMINGWIDRERYLAHHDPKRWVVDGGQAARGGGGIADAVTSAPEGEL